MVRQPAKSAFRQRRQSRGRPDFAMSRLRVTGANVAAWARRWPGAFHLERQWKTRVKQSSGSLTCDGILLPTPALLAGEFTPAANAAATARRAGRE